MKLARRLVYGHSEQERQVIESGRYGDERSAFEIDRARIIHCAAFRRLQGKTQVFGLGGSDFFRTRLTHSLETAQIGKGIALRVGADPDLVEAAALAHDIGHPPFGHVGEAELKRLMLKHGGFEANAQNFKILCRLEAKSTRYDGLNLTRATLDALLKYKKSFTKVKRKRPLGKMKFYYDDDEALVSWATKGAPGRRRSFECEIMDWADNIAYSTHDLEDGIKAGMVTREKVDTYEGRLRRIVLNGRHGSRWKRAWDRAIDTVTKATYKSGKSEFKSKARRKEAISDTVSSFVKAATWDDVDDHNTPARYTRKLVINPAQERQCKVLKELAWELIITDEHLATLERKAQNIVRGLFRELTRKSLSTFHLYPPDFRERLESTQKKSDSNLFRVACDYISGMTDAHAIRIYSRLVQPEPGSLFEFL